MFEKRLWSRAFTRFLEPQPFFAIGNVLKNFNEFLFTNIGMIITSTVRSKYFGIRRRHLSNLIICCFKKLLVYCV